MLYLSKATSSPWKFNPFETFENNAEHMPVQLFGVRVRNLFADRVGLICAERIRPHHASLAASNEQFTSLHISVPNQPKRAFDLHLYAQINFFKATR